MMGTVIVALGVVAATGAAPIQLVREGGSAFVIYHAPEAPSSVAMAASELQRYVHQVSGAKLAIVQTPRAPMICLGEGDAARQAGLTVDKIPVEGFRIVTGGGNIYILGPDTASGELTPGGGTSTGTRNGVYTFLERFLGVRWLIPGKHGDYVPRSSSIEIPETDLTDAPFFLNRRVPYTQQGRRDVKRWWNRQRLGWSLYLTHGHNWRRSIPATHFEEHPDWFPEHGGVRVPPTGRYKLCTTDPGLVQAFADAVIRYFDRHPAATCYSLSPSDSAGYCECERCSALYETDPNGKRSVTPAILTFYNGVAQIVAKRYPDKLLAGYVYAAYVFPPKLPIKLQPNLFLVWAPSFDYGFTLFRPQLQQQWEGLLKQWTEVTPNISYYDLPAKLSTESGALNPPGLKILKFLYPRLKAARVKGVYVYGIEAWGRGAPLNYLLARLAWNPEADVEALFEEFCAKAYGRGGEDVKQMFRLLDTEVEKYYLAHAEARYRLTTEIMRDIYAANFDQFERLYCSAQEKVQDPNAKARLTMIGENLTVLHWQMRQYRLLDQPKKSSFYLSDEDFFAFLSKHRDSLALHPAEVTKTPAYVKKKLEVTPAGKLPGTEPVRVFRLRGDQHLVLCPTGQEPVRVTFSRISARGKLVTYSVYGADGAGVSSGLVSPKRPIELAAGNTPYYHLGISAGAASFMVEVQGAAWAVDARLSDQGLHLLGKLTPVYMHVPEQTRELTLSLQATPPGETAIATLFAPNGKPTAEFDCTEMSVDRRKIAVPAGQSGWWKIDIKPAPVGAVDDVWVQAGDELSGFFSLAPEQALRVARDP